MSNQTTVVGTHTRISGNLHGEQDLRVSGRIDGTIELTGTLFVESEGVVVADIHAERTLISGTVVGNITATDVIEIAKAGRVVGDIVAPRVVIADGAAFRGNIDMGDLDAPRPSSAAVKGLPRRGEPAESPSPPPRPAEPARARPLPPRRPPAKPAPERAAPAPTQAPRREEAKGIEDHATAAKRRRRPPTTAGKKTRARRK